VREGPAPLEADDRDTIEEAIEDALDEAAAPRCRRPSRSAASYRTGAAAGCSTTIR
jgi:hypothetical protein